MFRVFVLTFSALVFTCTAFAQPFFQQSFESLGGWSISHTFDDGASDYVKRDSVAGFTGLSFTPTGQDGKYIIGGEDTNGEAGQSPTDGIITLSMDKVAITGKSNLEVVIAAGACPTCANYDQRSLSNGDYLDVKASIDGGSFVTVGQFSSVAGSNSFPIYHDADFSGIGDAGSETGLGAAMTDFILPLAGTGDSVEIQVVFRFESGSEEIVFDNIRLQESAGVVEPTTQATNVTTGCVAFNVADLEWTNGDGTSRIVLASESPIAVAPEDDSTYIANSNYGDGDMIAPGVYVVANTAAANVSLTGLVSGRTYHVQVFEYNGGASSEDYLTSSSTGNPGSFATPAFTNALPLTQGFEGSGTWNFCAGRDFINSGSKIFDIVDSIPNHIDLAAAGDKFFGTIDLDNNANSYLDFEPVDISAFGSVELEFQYYTEGFDAGDEMEYSIEYDTGSTWSNFVLLDKNSLAWNTVTLTIPSAEDYVRIRFRWDQNGPDYSGLDAIELREASGAPEVTNGELLNASIVQVEFSIDLLEASAENTSNYTGIGALDSAVLNTSTSVLLYLTNPLPVGKDTLIVNNVQSSAGTPMAQADSIELERAGDVIITEIMYNSAGTDVLEFIEIYNNEGVALDVSGWQFTTGATFTFPASTTIGAGEYIVIARDSSSIRSAFNISSFEWNSGQSLTNTSETITLESSAAVLVDEVTYDDGFPWPSDADGTGPSLELCPFFYYSDNDDPANWVASSAFVTDTFDDGNGPDNLVLASAGADADCTPEVVDAYAVDFDQIIVEFNFPVDAATGENVANYTGLLTLDSAVLDSTAKVAALYLQTPLAVGEYKTLTIDAVTAFGQPMASSQDFDIVFNNTQPDLVITEFLYDDKTGLDSLEFIEIYNNGAQAQLGGLYFSAGLFFEFPNMTLDSAAYVVICRLCPELNQHYGTSFSLQWGDPNSLFVNTLGNGGELIEISNSVDSVIDFVDYNDAGPWPIFSGDEDQSLELCDWNLDNNDGSNWKKSELALGTSGDRFVIASPGTANCTETVLCSNPPSADAGADVVACPGAATTLTVTGGTAASWTPVDDLSCGVCLTTSATPVSTTSFVVTIADASGCLDADTVEIVAIDTFVPQITCPADIETCVASVTYTVTSTDNCEGFTQTLLSGLASSSVFPSGTTTNVWAAFDPAGNSDTCEFDVTNNGTGIDTIVERISNARGGLTASIGKKEAFGSSIVYIDDLNGDGNGDAVVGAPGTARADASGKPQKASGAIYVLFLDDKDSVIAEQEISLAAGGLSASSLAKKDGFGSAITELSDYDGDGVNELAVGAFGATSVVAGKKQVGSGAIFVLFMNTDGTMKSSVRIDNTQNGFTGGGKKYGLGRALAAADIDGDGIDDILAGAPGSDNQPGNLKLVGSGELNVLFMNSDGTASSTVKLTSDDLTSPLEKKAGFGTAITASDDAVYVGAPGSTYIDASGKKQKAAGAVYRLILNTDATIASQQIYDGTVSGLETTLKKDGFGSSLANLGDISGDGVDDLGVGAPGDDRSNKDGGHIYLLSLATSGVIDAVTDLLPSGVALDKKEQLGTSLAAQTSVCPQVIGAGAIGNNDGEKLSGAVYQMFSTGNDIARKPVKGNVVAITEDGEPATDPRTVAKTVEIPGMVMQVYPNPSNGSVKVEFAEAIFGAGMIDLYSAIGRLVFSMQIENTDQIDLDLSGLNSGTYILNIQTEHNRKSMRLVLNK